jgi:hypothetical protein
LFTNGNELVDTGETDLAPYGLSFQSGDVFAVHLQYDGTTLWVYITDTMSTDIDRLRVCLEQGRKENGTAEAVPMNASDGRDQKLILPKT